MYKFKSPSKGYDNALEQVIKNVVVFTLLPVDATKLGLTVFNSASVNIEQVYGSSFSGS